MGRDYRVEYRNGYNNERPYSPGRYAGERYSPDRYSPDPQEEHRRQRSATPPRGRDRRSLAISPKPVWAQSPSRQAALP